MKSKILNLKATNESGVRPDVSYGNILDQKRYIYSLNYIMGKDVLDCASGVGWGTFLLANGGAKSVVGVDLSPVAIETANMYYSSDKVKFIPGSIDEIDLGIKFDVITSFETLEHVDEPVNFLKALRGSLKPDGLLLLSTPNGYCTKYEVDKPYNPYHLDEFTKDELFQLLKEAGWSIDKYLGQHPIQEGSEEVVKYREFNKRHWDNMRRAKKYGLLYKIFNRIRAQIFGLSSDPAQSSDCNPVLIKTGFQPVYHFVIAHAISE